MTVEFDPQDRGSFSSPSGNEEAPQVTPNDLMRAHLARARQIREQLALKESRAQGSVTGGTYRTDVLDTDANGLPLDQTDDVPTWHGNHMRHTIHDLTDAHADQS